MSATAIDWMGTQKSLGLVQDGNPGDITWTAILGKVASSKANPTDILAMARALKTFSMPVAGLITPARLAGYIANTANESGGFTTWSENLNYTAGRMATVWPSRYAIGGKAANGPNQKALKLAGDPIAFANDVYGARMGNERNGIADNDGFDFRGLGPLQTTGFDNFDACERHTGIPFASQPALMMHPGTGTIGALSWWSRSGCNDWLDKGKPKEARSVANAGRPDVTNPEGWPAVQGFYARLMEVLK